MVAELVDTEEVHGGVGGRGVVGQGVGERAKVDEVEGGVNEGDIFVEVDGVVVGLLAVLVGEVYGGRGGVGLGRYLHGDGEHELEKVGLGA